MTTSSFLITNHNSTAVSGVCVCGMSYEAYRYRPSLCQNSDGTLKISVLSDDDTLIMSLTRGLVTGLTTLIIGYGYITIMNTVRWDDTYKVFEKHYRDRNVRPLLTASNHTSLIDDPGLIGLLVPPIDIMNAASHRWSLCGDDMCFKNEALQSFCGAGRVLPLKRKVIKGGGRPSAPGGGITQPSLKLFTLKCIPGEWLQIYPEGRIWQQVNVGGLDSYLRWGVGKVIAAAKVTPKVLCYYHLGMDTLAPFDENNNFRLANLGVRKEISVHFDEPLDFANELEEYWQKHKATREYCKYASLSGAILTEWDRQPTDIERELYSSITRSIYVSLSNTEKRARAATGVAVSESRKEWYKQFFKE